MRRPLTLLASGAVAVMAFAGLASCAPTSGRYISMIYSPAQITEQLDVTYGSAPSLPDRGNGHTTTPETLRLDVYKVTNAADPHRNRPLVVMVHGGGFKAGDKSQMADLANEWARRGYVALSVEYRTDDDNQCQKVQHELTTDPVLIRECEAAIAAAQHDTQAAIRWARARATTLGINPTKVAVWGSSAGAVTAVNVAYNSTDPGSSGTPGQSSKVQAIAAMSGAAYDTSIIGPGDSPVIQAHNPADQAVLYSVARKGADVALAKGLIVDFVTYRDTAPGTIHAMGMYEAHKAELDTKVTAFFYEHLQLTQT